MKIVNTAVGPVPQDVIDAVICVMYSMFWAQVAIVALLQWTDTKEGVPPLEPFE